MAATTRRRRRHRGTTAIAIGSSVARSSERAHQPPPPLTTVTHSVRRPNFGAHTLATLAGRCVRTLVGGAYRARFCERASAIGRRHHSNRPPTLPALASPGLVAAPHRRRSGRIRDRRLFSAVQLFSAATWDDCSVGTPSPLAGRVQHVSAAAAAAAPASALAAVVVTAGSQT